MLLLFYPQKSHRHPAPRELLHKSAATVYDGSAVLECKSTELFQHDQINAKKKLLHVISTDDSTRVWTLNCRALQ